MFKAASFACLLLVLLCSSGAAETGDWLQVRTPNFLIVTNSNEKDARHTARQFESMRSVFQKVLPDADLNTSEPILVLAVTDKYNLEELEPVAYLGQRQLYLVGYFASYPERNYVLILLNAPGLHPYSPIYHEYAHFVFSRVHRWMPLWLWEGIATFYQTTEILNGKAVLGKADAYLQSTLEHNQLIPLPTLFAVDTHSSYYHKEDQGSVFYAESWALTHYLKDKDDRDKTHRFADYIDLLQTKGPVAAATEAFGDLDQMLVDLRKYMAATNYSLSEVTVATDVDDSAFAVQTLSIAQSDNLRAEFLAHDGRYSDARTLLQRILRDDSSNAAAYETSCYIDILEREFEDARDLCQRAVKLDPNNFLAHYWFGLASMKAGKLDKAGQEDADENLRAAIGLKPTFAPAYDVLAMSYATRGVRLTEAHDLIEKAVQLLPGAPEVHVDEAQVLLNLHKDKEASDALQLALKLAHTPEQVAGVENVMKSLQDIEAQQAKFQKEPVRLAAKSGAKSSKASSQSETPPHAIYSPEVEYTEQARAAKLEGVCVVRIFVGPDGKPGSVVVTRKLGMGLDEKAAETVKKWRFDPGRRYGQPVPSYLTLSLEFKLFGQSTEKIFQLSTKAKEGDPTAELELANAFFSGRDVTRDDVQGMVLLERAARSGLTEAQFQMGERIYGDGTNADKYVMAYLWYCIAGRSGTEQAETKVSELEARMTPTQLGEARKRVDAWPDEPSK
jgi:TonB family protein